MTSRINRAAFSSHWDVVHGGIVRGWVTATPSFETVPTICVSANGREIAHVRSIQEVQTIGNIRHRRNRYLFNFELPPTLYSNEAIEITVRLNGGTSLTPSSATIRSQDRFVGELVCAAFTAAGGCIRGWVGDKVRPDRHVRVQAILDSQVVGEVIANTNEAGDGADHGFVLPLRCGGKAFRDRGQVTVADSRVVISKSDAFFEVRSRVEPCIAVSRSIVKNDQQLIVGAVDGFRNGILEGWAVAPKMPDRPVELALSIDGKHYASTKTELLRPDIRNRYGGSGMAGFAFELNADLLVGPDRRFVVKPTSDTGKLQRHEGVLKGWPSGKTDNKQFETLGRTAVARRFIETKALSRTGPFPRVAIIVLNLNGAHLLRDFFSSFFKHNTYRKYEIIVVDHGSSDESEQVVRSQDGSVRLLQRNSNYSFSDSNNYAARRANADILIFANNDIVFCEDVIGSLVASFRHKDVGVVGIKLKDPPSEGTKLSASSTQHLGVHFDPAARGFLPTPYETRPGPHLNKAANAAWDVPAVTAALMACRRTLFNDMGGFDTSFYYGYEDIDLSLRLRASGRRNICRNDLQAIHRGGSSRYDKEAVSSSSQGRNRDLLSQRWGAELRRSIRRDLFRRPSFWTTQAPVIAFAVSATESDTAYGDFYTAWEFGDALGNNLASRITFLPPSDWYDLQGVDVLVAMLPNYDPRRIRRASSTLTTIAWARNSFEDWASQPSLDCYNIICAASKRAASFLAEHVARPIHVVPIATNARRFRNGTYREELRSDFCFTGSYHRDARDVAYVADQVGAHAGKIFGHNWHQAPRRPSGIMGPIAYEQLPDVYASTKIVLDDANSVTKTWGSVNSRVFDALAAKRLVVTNGELGARELFGRALPTYSDAPQLANVLEHFLRDEKQRSRLANQLAKVVLAKHTYDHRAKQVSSIYDRYCEQSLRFAIKISASEQQKDAAGDFHFAQGIARALARAGHTARIDCLEHWYGPLASSDDVVLVLRGATAYVPKPGVLNLVWVISHPDAISGDELASFDHVFVASEPFAEELASLDKGIHASVLLSCTDPAIFNPESEDASLPAYDLLFVGDARGRLPPAVEHALKLKRRLAIIGAGWDGLVTDDFVVQASVPNSCLSTMYRKATAVLFNHWPDMRKKGFISHRLFDAAAAGASILTDDVKRVRDVFGASVGVFQNTPVSFARELKHSRTQRNGPGIRKRLSALVQKRDNFDVRVKEILRIVNRELAGNVGQQLLSQVRQLRRY